MSSSDFTDTSTPNNSKTLHIPQDLKLKLASTPEAIDFIESLIRTIKRQRKKLKKLYKKQELHDKSIQCDINVSSSKTFSDEIREAAEIATQKTGFLFDEVSGLYYDRNTGYYYNAEYGLYYESKTGTYMSYNTDTKSYDFHSQVKVPHTNSTTNDLKEGTTNVPSNRLSDIEDGECSNSDESDKTDDGNQAAGSAWPPCMRIIVEKSNCHLVRVGSLHIVTYQGGTLGREGSNHAVILPDLNVSKTHLKFSFEIPEKNDTHVDEDINSTKTNVGNFVVCDLGSRNGTILNGQRLSGSKQTSELHTVPHGSRIELGSGITLSCHIHEGMRTCGLCEPGLIQEMTHNTSAQQSSVLPKPISHKAELKKLRKKFGLSVYEDGIPKLPSGYTDRAEYRRLTIGSQNEKEKTQVASINESIGNTNKGFKLLEKMGWKEGESLGKDGHGITEPISTKNNPGTVGMGNNTICTPSKMNTSDKCKQIVWRKAKERFNNLQVTCDAAFNESDSDDNMT